MIRLFVGCAANGEDIESQIVLEHTLRKHCSQDIDITWMMLSRDEKSFFSGWKTDLWSTPFSGFRWAVPELCSFEGRAIYMDSDIIGKADLTELWNVPIDLGKVVVAKGGNEGWRFCVSLWDCSAARKYLPDADQFKGSATSHRSFVNFFKTNKEIVQSFSNGNWNCIDGENYPDIDHPQIKLLHYSSEAHQPQLKHALPRLAATGRKHWFDGEIKPHWRPEIQHRFDLELKNALLNGYRVENYEPEKLYGPYVKKSEKNYKSHQWAR